MEDGFSEDTSSRQLGPTVSDIAAAEANRAAFLASLTDEWKRREASISVAIANRNASAKVKLREVYALVDEMALVRRPFEACRGKGCSECCRINVMISSEEASVIAQASGRRAEVLYESKFHDDEKFSGTACPFLGEAGECTVYEARPLECRLHSSFYSSPRWCEEDVSHLPAPMVNISGPRKAAVVIASSKKGWTVGDIRDYFPATSR